MCVYVYIHNIHRIHTNIYSKQTFILNAIIDSTSLNGCLCSLHFGILRTKLLVKFVY